MTEKEIEKAIATNPRLNELMDRGIFKKISKEKMEDIKN